MAQGFGHALDLAGPVVSPFTATGLATAAMAGYNPFDAMMGAAMSMPFHLFSR